MNNLAQKTLKVWHIFIILSLILPALLLQGCSSSNARTRAIKRAANAVKRDGAPKQVPKGFKTHDAIPKAEPLARYGNRFKKGTSNSYVALGKRYHVMQSSRGYRARGKASWYGTQFHGRRTSSGERYDMYQMTAAHPNLPLPCYIKVTNLHSGKTAVLKVNDRGPFHPDRILDVSYAAAAKLGILAPGSAHVEIESIDPRDHGGYVPKHMRLKHYSPTLAGDSRIQTALRNTAQKKQGQNNLAPVIRKAPLIKQPKNPQPIQAKMKSPAEILVPHKILSPRPVAKVPSQRPKGSQSSSKRILAKPILITKKPPPPPAIVKPSAKPLKKTEIRSARY